MPNPTDPPSPAASYPARWRWLITGIVLAAGLSAITGVVSYNHGLTVARGTGNAGLVSYLLPLVPDLMIAMSSLVLFVDSMLDAERPHTALGALVAGIGWTVAQNVAAGWHQGWGARTIDAGVPLALVVTFESLLWLFRRFRQGAREGAAGSAEPLGTLAVLRLLLDSAPERDLAFMMKVDRMKVRAWSAQLETALAELDGEPPERGRDGTTPAVPAASEPAAGASQGHALAALNGSGPHPLNPLTETRNH